MTKRTLGWKTLGCILALIIAGLGLLGSMAISVDVAPWYRDLNNILNWRLSNWLYWFNLDGELNVVVLFSASLLIANGLLVRQLVQREHFSKWAMILVAMFIFMGADEVLTVHEKLERVTGIDWQILYIPVVFVAGLGWLYVWRTVSENIQWGGWSGWGSSGEKSADYDVLIIGGSTITTAGGAAPWPVSRLLSCPA